MIDLIFSGDEFLQLLSTSGAQIWNIWPLVSELRLIEGFHISKLRGYPIQSAIKPQFLGMRDMTHE